MKYAKPALTYEDQADLLLSRGLIADKTVLVEKLRAVNYYRLSGYWFPFRIPDDPDDKFQSGTKLEQIWQRYTFDRQLRLLVMDAIERVEVSVKTKLSYNHSHTNGPLGYIQKHSVPNLNDSDYSKFLTRVLQETANSKEQFIVHFKVKYGDLHSFLPLWMAMEILSFGTMFTFFKGIDRSLKLSIAGEYEVPFGVLESWLSSLNIIRNICAHHGRLWNKVLGIKPQIPSKDKRWHEPVKVTNNRMFGILTILKYMMNQVAPQSSWAGRFQTLLSKYPQVPIDQMGFPENWQECPVWKEPMILS